MSKQPQRPNKRPGYNLAEFSALFGKNCSWGYRQVASGNVEAIRVPGEMIISDREVNRFRDNQNGP